MFFLGKTSAVSCGRNKTKREHQITVISEGVPNEKPKYVHHYTTKGESGLAVAGGLFDYIVASDSIESIRATGTDGTAAMSSPNVGAHRYIEVQLGRALQRIFCLFHMAELPGMS